MHPDGHPVAQRQLDKEKREKSDEMRTRIKAHCTLRHILMHIPSIFNLSKTNLTGKEPHFMPLYHTYITLCGVACTKAAHQAMMSC
jgi:hypothetical protein